MATETGSAGATVTRPADVGLKREMGLIGAIWASESSIIGSGWLFAALYAAAGRGAERRSTPGSSAASAVVILALVHAELGAMYPVAGGTARFPHLAFGGIAGMSFGFFSWLQAVTVAPGRVLRGDALRVTTGGPPTLQPDDGDVTGTGLGLFLASC